jgi:hypothetical protein
MTFKLADIFFKNVQQGAVFYSPVGMAEDEDMGQVLKAAWFAVGEDYPGGLKEGPPLHLVQEGFDMKRFSDHHQRK